MFEVSEECRICSRCRRRGHYSRDCKITNNQGSFESMKTETYNCSFPSTHNNGGKNNFYHKKQHISSHHAKRYKYHKNHQSKTLSRMCFPLRYTPKYELKKQDSKNRFNIYSTAGLRQD